MSEQTPFVEVIPGRFDPIKINGTKHVGAYCMIPPYWTWCARLEVVIVRVGKIKRLWGVFLDEGDNCGYHFLGEFHRSRKAALAAAEAVIAERDNPTIPQPLVAAYITAYLRVNTNADPMALEQRAADLWVRWRQAGYPLAHKDGNSFWEDLPVHTCDIDNPECRGTCDALADLRRVVGHRVVEEDVICGEAPGMAAAGKGRSGNTLATPLGNGLHGSDYPLREDTPAYWGEFAAGVTPAFVLALVFGFLVGLTCGFARGRR